MEVFLKFLMLHLLPEERIMNMARRMEDLAEEHRARFEIAQYNLEQTRIKLRQAERDKKELEETIAYQQRKINELQTRLEKDNPQ